MNRNGSFADFSKTVSYKIPEMIETSEKYLHRGDKITILSMHLRKNICGISKPYVIGKSSEKNCRFCGNYWVEYSPDWTPHNILCNC